jgi:pantetheine-phosphate adenylyltransferase
MARIAVFPGSFDPIHNGHLDLVERSAPLFDELYLGVLNNESKEPLFSAEERVAMLRELFRDTAGVRVEAFSGLLVELASQVGARAIIRGLRGVADFDYELQMTLMNRHLREEVETLFLMPRGDLVHLSSRLIKEVCRLGGDVAGLVPELVLGRLRERLGSR